MRAEGQNHYPYILGMALNHYKIKPKVSIWIRLQPGLENWQFSVNKNKEGMCCQLQTGWNSINCHCAEAITDRAVI